VGFVAVRTPRDESKPTHHEAVGHDSCSNPPTLRGSIEAIRQCLFTWGRVEARMLPAESPATHSDFEGQATVLRLTPLGSTLTDRQLLAPLAGSRETKALPA
jgi:hypothetical protein